MHLPAWVENAANEDPAIASLHERVVARWNNQLALSPRSPELFSFANTLSRNRSSSLRHLVGVIFEPTEADWQRRRLPENLFWLYGLLRAPRLIGKYFFRA